jgi:hypothetical protein
VSSQAAGHPPEDLLRDVVLRLRSDATKIKVDKHTSPALARKKAALEMLALEIEDVRGRLLAAQLD